MSKVVITNIVDENFGNCVQITNGVVVLKVTVDFGPRVIYFSRTGKENMFFEDLSKSPLGGKLDVYEDHLRLYGGHRIWISPEILPRCYYPDSAKVEYEINDGVVTFTAPVEKVNYIQKILTVALDEEQPIVNLSHTIKNCGVWDIELGAWCITMMAPGGKEIVPMPDRVTGLLANRNITLWDYSNMNDSRVHWGTKYITLSQDSSADCAFKFGINNEAGWAAYFNRGQVFYKYFEPSLEGNYPDNGCCYETYTNPSMLEMETLSEIVLLMPGEEIYHDEVWELYDAASVPSNDEDEITKALEK